MEEYRSYIDNKNFVKVDIVDVEEGCDEYDKHCYIRVYPIVKIGGRYYYLPICIEEGISSYDENDLPVYSVRSCAVHKNLFVDYSFDEYLSTKHVKVSSKSDEDLTLFNFFFEGFDYEEDNFKNATVIIHNGHAFVCNFGNIGKRHKLRNLDVTDEFVKLQSNKENSGS